jgi:hypothetical protein
MSTEDSNDTETPSVGRVLLDKQMVIQLVKKLPDFYEN